MSSHINKLGSFVMLRVQNWSEWSDLIASATLRLGDAPNVLFVNPIDAGKILDLPAGVKIVSKNTMLWGHVAFGLFVEAERTGE